MVARSGWSLWLIIPTTVSSRCALSSHWFHAQSRSLHLGRSGAGPTRLPGAGLTLRRGAPAGATSLRPLPSTSVLRLHPTGGDVADECCEVAGGIQVPVDDQAACLAVTRPP